jgi:Transposase DDE domain group 1
VPFCWHSDVVLHERRTGGAVLPRLLRLLLLSAALRVLRPPSFGQQAAACERDAADGAAEEVARVVAHIRAQWPATRVVLRADSGFAREELMAW